MYKELKFYNETIHNRIDEISSYKNIIHFMRIFINKIFMHKCVL